MTREDLLKDRQFLNKDDVMQMFGCSNRVAYNKINEIKSVSNIANMSGKVLVKDYENWLIFMDAKTKKYGGQYK